MTMRDLEDSVVDVLTEADLREMPGMCRTKEDRAKIVSLLQDLSAMEFDSRTEFMKNMDRLKRAHKLSVKNSEVARIFRELVRDGEMESNPGLVLYLRTKVGKSASGILSITVFTSPYPEFTDPKTGKKKKQKFTCEWNCYFCPNHPDHPRSYLPDEPGCLRAERCEFDPIRQVRERVATLRTIGHPVDKLEVLVLGGTWESYPFDYQDNFIRDLFFAANTFFDEKPSRAALSLPEEQLINESANCKIIGLTLETRPDTINPDSIRTLRYFGCTRLQIGIQHIDNSILKKINRRHTIEDAAYALKLLKDNCYKVDIHLMPDLPGATPELDRAMFHSILGLESAPDAPGGIRAVAPNHDKYLLTNKEVQADQWKIYPCEVTPWTVIEKWYKEGKYKPYGGGDGPELIELLIDAKSRVFPWIRLNRVIRDIPNQHILGGNANTNLRQHLQHLMKQRGLACHCIRCREVGLNKVGRQDYDRAEMFIREYEANRGTEYFLSFETPDRSIIFGFLRLRFSADAGKDVFPVLQDCGLIRELHVYGQLVPTYKKKQGTSSQHAGYGTRLMRHAEVLARKHGRSKLAVIAGIGTRNYYRKFGYMLVDTFMIKNLARTRWELWSAVAALMVALLVYAMLR